jgi:uncharacterized membrane protein
MGVNPNQGQNPDPSSGQYGGYAGYTPPQSASPKDDPYNAQWYGQAQPGTGQQPGAQQQSGADQQQQQYSPPGQQQQYYQPPLSATSSRQGSGGVNDISVFGLNARLAALLSYLFTWVGGIFFLLFERRNQFVRFAAAQSVTIFGPLFIVYFILQLITGIPLLGALLAPLIGCLVSILLLAGGLTWVFLMVQSYRGITVRIPIVSVYADLLLARFSRPRRGTTV